MSRRPSIDLRTSAEPDVSLIFLVLNRYDLLAKCLASVAATVSEAVRYEVVVVLNGSTDDVAAWLADNVNGVRVVKSRVNRGFSGGNNLGASAARGRYLVFVNDDTVAQRGWLEWLVRTADARPDAGAVGSRLLFPDGVVQEAGQVVWSDGSTLGVGRGTHDAEGLYAYLREVDYCSACSLLVRRTTWDRVEGFDEGYFPLYYEDVDLCLKIHEHGETVLYEPRSRLIHDEAQSQSSDFRSFLFRRNGRRFREKWASVLVEREPPAPTSKAGVARAVHRARGFPRRVLIADDRVPTAVGSGFGRMNEIVEELAQTNAITFLARDWTADDLEPLQGLGVDVVFGSLAHHIATPEAIYDVIIVSRPYRIEPEIDALRRYQPQAGFVYDCEALAYRRVERQQAFATTDESRAALAAEAERLRAAEHGTPFAFDYVVAVTDEEATILRSLRAPATVEVITDWAPREAGSSDPAGRHGAVLSLAGWPGRAPPIQKPYDGSPWRSCLAFARSCLSSRCA